jgi:hypothetical protein
MPEGAPHQRPGPREGGRGGEPPFARGGAPRAFVRAREVSAGGTPLAGMVVKPEDFARVRASLDATAANGAAETQQTSLAP